MNGRGHRVGQVVGGYKLTAYLGGGGMADVYLGLDLMLEREVALKIPLPELASQPHIAERFRSEAVLLAKLNHPHIATLYSFHRDVVGDFFMAMEYVPGRTLDATLREGGALKPADAVKLFAQILDGIGHAHAQGIIHRDLKPANVMLTPTGTVKIMDFGIAHALGGQRMTLPGRLIGTFEYMSPEQVLGQATDPRSDIYALGILLFEMVTGRVPFSRDSEYELMRAQLEEPPPPPREFAPETPEVIEQAILRALQKRREDRFPSVVEFRTALAPPGLATTPQTTRFLSDTEFAAQAEAARRAEAERHAEAARLAAELRQQAEAEAAQILAAARRRAAEEASQITAEQRRRAEQEAERLAVEKLRAAEAAAAELLAESQRQAEAETMRAAHVLRQVEEAVQQQHAAQEAKRLQQQQAEEARLQRERAEVERLHHEAETHRRQAEAEAAELKAAALQQAEAERRQRAEEEEARQQKEAALRHQREAEQQRQREAEAERLATQARQRAEQEATRRAQEIQQQAEQEAARLLAEARQRVTATSSGESLSTAVGNQAEARTESPTPRRWSRVGKWSVAAMAIVTLGLTTFWLQSKPETLPDPPPPPPSRAATPRSTPEMIRLEGATFWLGRKDETPQEGEDAAWASLQSPAHKIAVKTFEMDKTEVTNAEYAEFVEVTKHAPPAEGDWPNGALLPGRERWPVRYVNYADAEAFARWRSQRDGKHYRLPTEAEWEYAAKGTDDRRYPWGNDLDDTRANLNSGTPKPVGSYPAGAAWAGVVDLLGNVAEWTSSPAQTYSDKIPQPGFVIVRGGAFHSGQFKNRPPSVTARGPVQRDTRDLEIGFRLVRELP